MANSPQNPFLPGFHPDPSVCRVGDDYYVATSTFEWYPGVLIYRSKDLCDWQLVARPLDRADLLDLRGVPDSCGVWAPCLTHADGKFWLCYTVTRRFDGNFKDTPNFVTTCETIDGEWSAPTYLNASGFDPSLFHDDDGKKWLLNMIWDHRDNRSFFHGIAMQEFDASEGTLIGERELIFEGSELGYTEGPHLYRFGEYYYLITAEGGTGYDHAVTLARSRYLKGPYEVDPEGPITTASHDPQWPLQRAGHGDLVQTVTGDMYLVHLCSRPLDGQRLSPLGRESAIRQMRWTEDGWLRPANGDQRPAIERPGRTGWSDAPVVQKDDFDATTLDPVFQWLRTPDHSRWCSLSDRRGYLRLYGQESPGSLFEQSLIARRQQHHHFEVETDVEFEPQHFQQLAGLICYYNASKFHYLYISNDNSTGKHLGVMSCNADAALTVNYPIPDGSIPLDADRPVRLHAKASGTQLRFAWCYPDTPWQWLAPTLDLQCLTDEAGKGEGAQFTGNFVGIACHDVAGTRLHADFDYFYYASLPASCDTD